MSNGGDARFDAFVATAPGVEEILRAELMRIGIVPKDVTAGGVAFNGRIEHVMRVNLWSRVASRVVVRVDSFHASTFHELERRAKKIAWNRYLTAGRTVRFRVTCRKSTLYHSDAVAERLGRVASAAQGAKIEKDVDEDSEIDAQLFIVRIVGDTCTISVDSSGTLLHRRGYRQAVAKAPLRETLAAAMLYGSGWDMASPLIDPMCGSGTIPIEAAMMARRIAPGAGRSFSFERWPDHDPAAWMELVDRARAEVFVKADVRILGSDRDTGAVAAALENASRAGVSSDIEIRQSPVSEVEFGGDKGWVVSNPPYGVRIGEAAPLKNLYAKLGNIMRDRAPGYILALLSADPALEAQLGMELREVFQTSNGGIPVRLVTGQALAG